MAFLVASPILGQPPSKGKIKQMIALIQRVKHASVCVDKKILGEISPGLLIFLGVEKNDAIDHCQKLCDKICKLRIFPDQNQVMNINLNNPDLSLYGAPFNQAPLEVLIISQFTLAADTRKGNRPSYHTAAPPAVAKTLYEAFVTSFKTSLGSQRVATGEFGADMDVNLTNAGPVTFHLSC